MVTKTNGYTVGCDFPYEYVNELYGVFIYYGTRRGNKCVKDVD